jgi:hypothetical protein
MSSLCVLLDENFKHKGPVLLFFTAYPAHRLQAASCMRTDDLAFAIRGKIDPCTMGRIEEFTILANLPVITRVPPDIEGRPTTFQPLDTFFFVTFLG